MLSLQHVIPEKTMSLYIRADVQKGSEVFHAKKLNKIAPLAEQLAEASEWDNTIYYLPPRVELVSWQRLSAHSDRLLDHCQSVSD